MIGDSEISHFGFIMKLKSKKKNIKKKRRSNTLRAIASVLPKISGPALRKRGFATAEIVTRWPEIAGEIMAAESAPDHLSFPKNSQKGGTLYISASGSVALQIQHQEPNILQRINVYFGYPAISRISISQTSHRFENIKKVKKDYIEPTPQQITQIKSATRMISKPDLRHALDKLGMAVQRDHATLKSKKPNP